MKFFSFFLPKIGHSYHHENDYGGKFSDGSSRLPLEYIPTEIKNYRVYYDVISPNVGFIHGDSTSLLAFMLCFRKNI